MDEHVGVVAPSKRMWTLIATSTVTVLSMMDQTIANTALPTIAHDINASAAASIWVINGYQLALTVGIVPMAAAGDILGYWRVYRLGLIVFMLASLGCVLSHELVMLTASRFVQGLAGAALTVTSSPINRLVYPPKMLGRATGVSAMAVSLGAAAGPVVGGAILALGPWQWLFALNIPIGIAVYAMAIVAIPKTPGHRRPYDALSAVMSVAMFGLAVIGFDSFGHHGSVPLTVTEIVAAAIVGWLFIRRQLATTLPMFAVDLFAQLRFTLAVLACYASFISQTIAWVALPFALQTVMGYKPLEIGLLLLPWLLASAAVAPFSGRLADRYNSSRLAVIGLGTFSVGLLCTTLMGPAPSPFDIAWRMAVCGIGYGLFQSPNNRSMQGSAPRERSGAPQAVQGVARVFGQTTGAVIVAIVFALEGHPTANGSGITDGALVITMAAATGCALLATLASLWRGVAVGSIVLAKAS